MSRYIDADNLKNQICDLPKWVNGYNKEGEYWEERADGNFYPDDVMSSIDNQPTVDVVEVVRCKDCVYAVKDKPTDTFFECDFHGRRVMDTDYYSWG